jgi:molecular chaperone DnaJ
MIQWHPDKNPDCGRVCDEKFQLISKAYEILKDTQKRADYD